MGRHTGRAPAALAARVAALAQSVSADGSIDGILATAGAAALERVATQAGDRSVALDLLAADALITLALLARAQHAPDQLGDFARTLLPVRGAGR